MALAGEVGRLEMGDVSRKAVQEFYEALASRDPVRIAARVADDVEWHIAGPVEIFPFCGLRRGRAAVIDYFARLVPRMFSIRSFELEDVVVDGNRAGLFSKVVAVQRDTGRVITFSSAHFVVFRDERVISMHALTDTFDVAEQVVGHRIDPYREGAASSDLVAL